MKLSFTIQGKPIAKARARITRYGNYDPQEAIKKRIAWEINAQLLVAVSARSNVYAPEGQALDLDCCFYMPIPKSRPPASVLHTKKPDLDNLVKMILDCITLAGLWHDDSQVVRLSAMKVYSPEPRTSVTVSTFQ